MDVYTTLTRLENELFKATQSYSQSNPCQMIHIRNLRKDIKKVKEQIQVMESADTRGASEKIEIRPTG